MNTVPDVSVVDTNVPIVANGVETDVSVECQLTCIDVLQTIVRSKQIALDDGNLIFDEYRRYLSFAGQPGVGDEFMKWVHDHMWDESRCVRVALTQTDGRIDEFPDDPALEEFDLSDHKFAAVTLLAGVPVLNATDVDWKHHEVALETVGVHVIFLCPDDLSN
jgi:hypothetical protein